MNDSDILIIGDLNSYAAEQPIQTLQAAGYVDLVDALGGSTSYSYVFDGQLGYLDYALASPSLVSQVVDIAEWHINADEIPQFDYNDDVLDTGEASFEEEPDGNPLYEPNPFRTSDHDPVIVGLNLSAPGVTASGPYETNEGDNLLLTATAIDLFGDVTYAWDLDGDGIFEIAPSIFNTVSTTYDDGPADITISVQACEGTTCVTDTTTVSVENVAPSVIMNTLPATPLFQGELAMVFIGGNEASNADTSAGFTFDVDCDEASEFSTDNQYQCVVTLCAGLECRRVCTG